MRLDLSLLRRPELGSVLLGRERESARVRTLRVQVLLVLTLLGSNLVGVAVAAVLILLVLPGPDLTSSRFLWANTVVVPVYVLLAVVVGTAWVRSAVYRRVRTTSGSARCGCPAGSPSSRASCGCSARPSSPRRSG